MKNSAQDRKLTVLLILPAFTLAELLLGIICHAPSPWHPHYVPARWISNLLAALFLGNLIASLAIIIWLKGFRYLAVLVAGGNLMINLIVTLLTTFMIAGAGF